MEKSGARSLSRARPIICAPCSATGISQASIFFFFSSFFSSLLSSRLHACMPLLFLASECILYVCVCIYIYVYERACDERLLSAGYLAPKVHFSAMFSASISAPIILHSRLYARQPFHTHARKISRARSRKRKIYRPH